MRQTDMTTGTTSSDRYAALADRCHRLVRFLHEVAATRSGRVRAVEDHPLTVWLDDIPAGVALSEAAGSGEVLLTAPAAAVLPPPPAPPAILAGRLSLPDAAHADPGRPPVLTDPAADPNADADAGTDADTDAGAYADADAETDAEAEAAYDDWLPGWRIWATRARADAERRALHNTLHAIAARVAQEGDAVELVLATGLLTWAPPGGPTIREHLLTTRLSCEIDPVSADIRLRIPADAATSLQDGPLLDDVPAFRGERTNVLHERLRTRPAAPLGPEDDRLLRDWLTLALDVSADGFEPGWAPPPPTPDPVGSSAGSAGSSADAPGAARAGARRESRPRVTSAPALVLRARDESALLTYYERMLDVLRSDERPPLGLVQLVETLDADDRLAWLRAEGATSGAELGDDPLLPLPASPEQTEVLARLRHDNGVVVEGPPGTGKTHTIANLVSALLAQGQRVLVTSQKAQALRVLREKLPADLQRLCVSLTDMEPVTRGDPAGGGSDTDAARPSGLTAVGSPELATSVSALAAEKAAYHPAALDRRIALAVARRDEALRTRATLAAAVRAARAQESAQHADDEVGPGWGGTRAGIATGVRTVAGAYDWLPVPVPRAADGSPAAAPLSDAEAAELHRFLRADPPDPSSTGSTGPPPAVPMDRVLSVADAAALMAAGRSTAEAARAVQAPLTTTGRAFAEALATVDPGSASVERLRDAVSDLVHALAVADDLHARERRSGRRPWIPAALDDALAGRDRVLWAKVATAAPMTGEAARLVADLGLHLVILPAAVAAPAAGSGAGSGAPAGPTAPSGFDPAALLAAGLALREHLETGGGLRRRFRPKVQRDADLLLTRVTVDGLAPTTPELLDLALVRLRAELAIDAASRAWALVGPAPNSSDPLEVRLSRLVEAHEALTAIETVTGARDKVQAAALAVAPAGVPALDSADRVQDLAAAVAALDAIIDAANAHRALVELHDTYARMAARAGAPSALADLADAVATGTVDGYARGRAELDAAAVRRASALRRDALLDRLRAAHPDLAAVLTSTATDPAWPDRLADFGSAWAWGVAASWLGLGDRRGFPAPTGRPAAAPAGDPEAELDAAEDLVAAATADLAGARAWKHCLERMGAEQSAALRGYADAVAAAGTDAGRHAERYRQAAREAMEIAQTAVPAWVMPIREVLSTIPAVRDSFDVVIVDEGSQAGLDSLFLLWLAPRVIVVGDDRQCTPSIGVADGLDPVFDRLDALLPDVPAWLRVGFTPRSSLFSLLRTRFGEVIRLREHFRCMPEIIEWSSAMFYRDAPLVPLRQFGADRLPPLVARFVPPGITTNEATGPRNPAEAEALVAQVLACAEDPRYHGLTFGVVVLQGTAQVTLIRDQLASRMSASEHQRRRLRVGTPADFQGDERDVVFLSLVVAPGGAITPLTRLEYQRRFNVAASRARDQAWLFHSVALADLDRNDLRHSYLSYVLAAAHPASAAAATAAPTVAEVSADHPHPRFGSLFEQRVFRAISGRGYLVTPQVDVGGRRVDLVVSGGRARLAVECDGDTGGDAEQIAHDFERERELRRAGWRFWRVRQSEFELDPDAALASLWARLAGAGILPTSDPASDAGGAGAASEASGPSASARSGGSGRGPGPGGGGGAMAAGVPWPSGGRDGEPSPVRASPEELAHRWRPIALSELEGLDDAPRPGDGAGRTYPSPAAEPDRSDRPDQSGGPVSSSGSSGVGMMPGT